MSPYFFSLAKIFANFVKELCAQGLDIFFGLGFERGGGNNSSPSQLC